MWTKERVLYLLETNDKAVGKALVCLYKRQTDSEKFYKTTKEVNNRGFSSMHAWFGTKCAQDFLKWGELNPGQLKFWRFKNKNGVSRIGRYHRQLLEEIEKKKA